MKQMLFAVLWVAAFSAQAQSKLPTAYTSNIRKADSLLSLKDYKKAAHAYSEAFKANGWKGRPADRYNAARAWSLAGISDSAFFSLDRLATKASYSDEERLNGEPDFEPLRNDKRWATLIESVKKNKLPQGWYRAGSAPQSYKMFVDSGVAKDGKSCASIQSTERNIYGFGTMMQNVTADKYRGKRVRISGYMKTSDVKDWAGLWMRVDAADGKSSLAFDNMKDGKTDRAVRGTTDWKKYDIVLDVPSEASGIAFGALLSGVGQIWFDELSFEVVDVNVPTTGTDETEPANLNFEK